MERHWRSPGSTLDSSEKILSFLSDVKDGKIEVCYLTISPSNLNSSKVYWTWKISSCVSTSCEFPMSLRWKLIFCSNCISLLHQRSSSTASAIRYGIEFVQFEEFHVSYSLLRLYSASYLQSYQSYGSASSF
jgi:hypothetical protein